MAIGRAPNARLRALVKEAGWTGQGFAEAVNAVGRESGLPLHYDRSAVAHWLSGTRPIARVHAVVAEALSRRLGRAVTAEEAGLSHPGKPVTAGNRNDTAAELAARTGAAYRVSADLLPDFPAPPATLRGTGHRPERIGTSHVHAAELMLSVFCDEDTVFGGGHARRALSAYLATDIVGWLSADASQSVRRRLLGVAARLSYVAGYMCFDERLGGAAQSYCLTAARLSAEAVDAAGYATVLRGMSVQAFTLGHHREALRLAETAASATKRVPAAQAAFLAGQLGLASAATGDGAAAITQLGIAERYLQRADGQEARIGSYHEAALEYQRAEALAALGDNAGAVRALSLSLRLRPEGERRARALTSARLAGLHLRQGALEQACALWQRFCDDYPLLHSARADSALRSLRASLRPFRRHGAARAVLERTEAFLAPIRQPHRVC